MMVQIIPRVIFTLPSTISAMHKIICLIIFSARFVLSHPQLRWTPAWHPCWRWSPGLCWHWQFCGTWKVTKLSLSSSCPKLSSASRVCCGWWHHHRDEDGWPAPVPGCRSGSGQSWHHPSSHLSSGPSYRTSQFSFTSSCPGRVWVRSLQKWPQGAAWAWVHF